MFWLSYSYLILYWHWDEIKYFYWSNKTAAWKSERKFSGVCKSGKTVTLIRTGLMGCCWLSAQRSSAQRPASLLHLPRQQDASPWRISDPVPRYERRFLFPVGISCFFSSLFDNRAFLCAVVSSFPVKYSEIPLFISREEIFRRRYLGCHLIDSFYFIRKRLINNILPQPLDNFTTYYIISFLNVIRKNSLSLYRMSSLVVSQPLGTDSSAPLEYNKSLFALSAGLNCMVQCTFKALYYFNCISRTPWRFSYRCALTITMRPRTVQWYLRVCIDWVDEQTTVCAIVNWFTRLTSGIYHSFHFVLFINENIGRSPNNNIVDSQWHSGNFFPGFDNNEAASNYKAKRQPSILWNGTISITFSRYSSNGSVDTSRSGSSPGWPASCSYFQPLHPSHPDSTAARLFSPPTIVGSCHGRGMRPPYSINVLIPIEISYG